MLFHLHIPKTGGTTLFSALASRIAPDRRVQVARAASPDHLTAQIVGAALVGGHLTWAAVGAFPTPPAVLTVLRDPIERALSLYGYKRKYASAGVFALDETQHVANEASARSLNEILLDRSSPLRAVLGLVQVDFLSSDSIEYRSSDGEVDDIEVQRRYEIAARNLESCAWVGTTETLDRDLQTLAFRFGWPPFGIPERHMVTPKRSDASTLTVRARRELDRLVEADRELHARARALADERHRAMIDDLLAERAQALPNATT